MILMSQIFDVIANENARYKRNELELGDNTLFKTGICDRKMIQFMPANHSITNRVITILNHSDKTYFQNVFVMLLRRVARDVTSSLLSWHKRYDFNAANCRRHSQ